MFENQIIYNGVVIKFADGLYWIDLYCEEIGFYSVEFNDLKEVKEYINKEIIKNN
jgi:hypothetical protein